MSGIVLRGICRTPQATQQGEESWTSEGKVLRAKQTYIFLLGL